jgi:hypothetical protein
MTLPWDPGQQSCEILFKFIYRVRSYGPDKLFAYVLTIMCIVTLTSDLGSRSSHFLESSETILWNIIPIHAFSENLWHGQCLNHYEHSDLDLWVITLDQDHDTSLGPGQQSCEILFKFIKRVRSYDPDKLFAYVLTIMCVVTFDKWPWIKVVTLPWVQCNNSVKYYSHPCFQWKLKARTMFKPLWA